MKSIDSINYPKADKPQKSPKPEKEIQNIESKGLNPDEISLLRPKAQNDKSKSNKFLKIILLIIAAAIVVLGSITISKAVNLSSKIFVGQKTSFFQKITDVIRGRGGEVRLVGEDLGQINILLLGVGGEGHDGPFLTDTMILAQIRPDIGQIALTSIPRDYLINLPDNIGARKINSAFAEGLARYEDYNIAGRFARLAVEEMSGLKIPYFAVMDFEGFEKAIDEIGGLDIYVERTFTDSTFPNGFQGYLPPITFKKGWQNFSGKKALQFVRSRHASGIEGSDFARSQRQQKVIQAFKDKVNNLYNFSGAGKINNLLNIFADHFHTNISPGEILRMYNLVKTKNIQNFLSLSLDPSTGLICPKILEESGAYVLVPCEGKNKEDIKNFFKNVFALGQMNKEKAVIWLASSSGSQSAQDQAQKLLKQVGLTVWQLPYDNLELPTNIYYEVNPRPATAEFIKNTLSAKQVTLPPPGIKIDKDKVDIIVILGKQK